MRNSQRVGNMHRLVFFFFFGEALMNENQLENACLRSLPSDLPCELCANRDNIKLGDTIWLHEKKKLQDTDISVTTYHYLE